MNKENLINSVSQATGLSVTNLTLAFDSAETIITQALVGSTDVDLNGFGMFSVETTEDGKKVKFRAGNTLAKAVC
jgi:nucleoid DNA-binding protein